MERELGDRCDTTTQLASLMLGVGDVIVWRASWVTATTQLASSMLGGGVVIVTATSQLASLMLGGGT